MIKRNLSRSDPQQIILKLSFAIALVAEKDLKSSLVGKTLIESEDIRSSRPISAAYFGGSMGSFMEVGETEPVFVDIETFRYAYKCKHCGHKWVEIKKEDY